MKGENLSLTTVREESRATRAVKSRYNRLAPLYDFMQYLAEHFRYRNWRRLVFSRVQGHRILEVGVGTGKNFPHYPGDAEVTAVDFSEKMLARAQQRAERLGIRVCLRSMDVEKLEFPDNSFDSVVATFVFCSVPDPVGGLKEVRRVTRTGGRVILLEHVLPANRILALFMNLMNPVVSCLTGANLNRRTVENVKLSGLSVERVTELGAGVFKLIEARKG